MPGQSTLQHCLPPRRRRQLACLDSAGCLCCPLLLGLAVHSWHPVAALGAAQAAAPRELQGHAARICTAPPLVSICIGGAAATTLPYALTLETSSHLNCVPCAGSRADARQRPGPVFATWVECLSRRALLRCLKFVAALHTWLAKLITHPTRCTAQAAPRPAVADPLSGRPTDRLVWIPQRRRCCLRSSCLSAGPCTTGLPHRGVAACGATGAMAASH